MLELVIWRIWGYYLETNQNERNHAGNKTEIGGLENIQGFRPMSLESVLAGSTYRD